MLEQLFHYPKVLANHRKAPLLIEREQFLQHCANQGMALSTLIPIANELRVIAQRLVEQSRYAAEQKRVDQKTSTST